MKSSMHQKYASKTTAQDSKEITNNAITASKVGLYPMTFAGLELELYKDCDWHSAYVDGICFHLF